MRLELHRQRGISLIEMMVGVVIGLLAVLVIYQMFSVAEGYKRNTTSISDAQQNGLFSSFTLGIELANAGSGIGDAALNLATCVPATADIATSFSPIPVLITDGGGTNVNPVSDSFVVTYGVATTLVVPATFAATAAPGAQYLVQSPNGFNAGDLIVAISSTGDCARSMISAGGVSAPDANGVVTISHTGAAITIPSGSFLLNMGPANLTQKVRYDVDANGVLRATSLINPATGQPDNGQTPNPLASNVVTMQLEYGIDNVGDGVVHAWVQASDAGWDPATLLALPTATIVSTIYQIKAVRIGIVVRGEQFDKNYNQTATWSLFDGALTGSIAAQAGGGNWRLRTYETEIPLRNSIWNPPT